MKSQFWTAPNQLTLLRLIFVPFIIISIMDRHYEMALIVLIVAGLSDGLDGLLARLLHQKTRLGEYLDPIADKLLLSSLFLVMSFNHLIPWRYTIIVFSRDLGILAVAAVLYATTSVRDFRPSIFGKVNTFCQIAAVFFVLLAKIYPYVAVQVTKQTLLYLVFAFTIISAVHYIVLTGERLGKATAGPNRRAGDQ